MKRITTVALVLLLGGFAATGHAEWVKPTEKAGSGHTAQQGGGPEGVGTVQYDPPGPADTFFGAYGAWYGNRFDTAFGGPLDTGNVTALAFYIGGADATFPFVGVFGSGGATPLFSAAISGIVPFTFNTVPVTGVATVAPGFLAGVFVSSAFGSSADSVGARTASTNGQGFHAEAFNGATGTFQSLNAMVRVTGSVFIPVELVGFEVE